ncbi:type II toxin-antitoxin system RelE/ParE family toxin [Trinickia sp. YCB016]
MRLVWKPQAIADRSEIMEYIAQDSPSAAIDIDEAIEEQVESLIRFPELGRHGRVPGTCELVIARTPYIAVYALDLERSVISVIRVLHGARLWPPERD